MKLVGIIGSIADESYNRKLMLYIASHFKETIDIEILDIRDVPMFRAGMEMGPAVEYLNKKISVADGVIIATPEHNHTTTAALKSVIEWLSSSVHPFARSEEHTSELQSRFDLVCRLLLEYIIMVDYNNLFRFRSSFFH